MKVWRQFIVVQDESRLLLEHLSNIGKAARSSDTALVLRGHGPWYPAMRGPSWGATCAERQPGDSPLSDLTPLLRILLDATPIPVSDAPSADVQTWLQSVQGAA